MRKRKHQVLSFIMSFALALALVPLSSVTVLAAWDGSAEISDWYGDGTATDYEIDTAAELAGLAVVVNGTGADGFSGIDDFSGKTVTVTADIDLTGTSGWTPIGGFSKEFQGTFDGGGHTISNLAIGSSSSPDSTLNALGLFGVLGTSAKVEDLTMSVSIYSSYGTAANSAYIGAIAGYNIGTIENCSSSGTLAGGYRSYVGGIVGSSGEFSYSGLITGCDSSCAVSAGAGGIAGDAYAGGIAGRNDRSTVAACYATGDVTAGNGENAVFAGGLLGSNSGGTVTDSYAEGDVLTLDIGVAGGLTGYNDSTIQNCHATGSVTTGDGGSSGGFTGYNDSAPGTPSITNCYATGDVVSGDSSSDNDRSCAGGFAGKSYGGIKDCHASGSATAGDATATTDLGIFLAYAGGFVGLAEGGSSDCIENCYATGFAVVGSATVDSAYSDSEGYVYAGGFAGHVYGMKIDNCHAVNYASCGSLSLAGTGNVGGAYAGGFAGKIYGYKQSASHVTIGYVKNSYSTGDVSGATDAAIGGFAGGAFAETLWGSVSYTLVSNCYATGDVTGNSCGSIGGFIGHNYYSAIENCYGAGVVSDAGSPVNLGGFAGSNEAYSDTAILENAYYDVTKNPAPMDSAGFNSGTNHAIGLDTDVMTGAAGSISYATSSGSSSASTFADALSGGIGLLDLSSESYFFWADDSDDINGGYPVFAGSWQDSGSTASSFDGGDGSASSPYQISTNAQLAYLAKLINDSSTYDTYKALDYVLTADIDLGGNQWVPIGKSGSEVFEGIFEGEGHLISGLTIGASGAGETSLNQTGLFGCVGSTAVRGIGAATAATATAAGAAYGYGRGLCVGGA